MLGRGIHLNLKPFVTLQKLFVRLILKSSKFDPSFLCFVHLKILPLRSIFIYKVLKIFSNSGKCINNENIYRLKLRSANPILVTNLSLTFYTWPFILYPQRYLKTFECHGTILSAHKKFVLTRGYVSDSK